MTTWPKVGQLSSYIDAETAATPLSIMKGNKGAPAILFDQLPDSFNLFIGNNGGCMRVKCSSLINRASLYVDEEDHNLARAGIDFGNCICFLRSNVSC